MRHQPTAEQAEAELTLREAMLSSKLRDWRATLSVKAKKEKRFGFYSLYGCSVTPTR